MYDDIVTKYYSPEISGLKLARFRALISALTPDELCDFGVGMLDGRLDLKLRKFIESRIILTMSNGLTKRHERLIKQLTAQFQSDNFRISQRAASLLERIATNEHCPKLYSNKMLQALLASDYSSHRNRVYKLWRTLDSAPLEDSLVKNWRNRSDCDAVELIIGSFAPHLLDKYYEELLESLRENEYEDYVERRLYFRAPMTTNRLRAILDKDEVTYAVVCAKQRIPMPEKTARRLWANRQKSGRPDLLIWAFGESGLWNLLTDLEL